MRRKTLAALMLVAFALPRAAGATAVARNPDPYERFNRWNYALNVKLDKLLIRRLSLVTHGLTPGPIGAAVHNILETLNQPVVILNDMLQVHPATAARSTARLVINATVGLLGAVDVAKSVGIRHHSNGFGDTLGRYGVGPGPYIYLALAGPFDLRDLFGTGVDTVSTPLFFVKYAYKDEVLITLNLIGGLDERAEVDGELEALLADADDPYATLRSTYLQERQGEIDEGRKSTTLPDIPGPEPEPAPTAPAVEAAPAPAPPPAPSPSNADLID